MYQVFPTLKKQIMFDGELLLEGKVKVSANSGQAVLWALDGIMDYTISQDDNSLIYLFEKKELPEQHYEIDVSVDKIVIWSSSNSGYYYAIKTLEQMLNGTNKLLCCHIEDGPDLKVRGFMHDISRNKVPKIETIKYIIDIMSDLKMNHLELYVEGFSFEYKSFPQYLEKESYITVLEYQELERYANQRFIDFVPNQNGFGHMADWLAKDEFKSLAEAPNGIHLWGTHRASSTLNALDEGSIELVKKMYKDMLPISNSKYFNMNFDEPFELGKDRTKEACEKYGEANVYLDYVDKAYQEIKKYNKIPLIWGDVLIRHDDVFERIPKDMVFVDWGYEAEYPFNTNLAKLKKAGIKFMAAPASTTWCSLLGRTYDWFENIYNAVWNTWKLGGEGVLLTDWGDVGHLQHLTATLAPLVFCGMLSYRVENGAFKKLKTYLNRYIFKDDKGIMADIVMDAGTYYKYEPHYTGNGTVTFYSMVWALNSFKEENPINYFKTKMKYNLLNYEQFKLLDDFFEQKKKELTLCNVETIFKDEVINSIEILQMIAKVSLSYQESIALDIRLDLLNKAIESTDGLIQELSRIWLVRNKFSGLNKSIENLKKMKRFAQLSKDYYQGGYNEKKNN